MRDDALFPARSQARLCYVRTAVYGAEPDLFNYHNLHPLEKSLASQAVNARKAELGDARWCAHQALGEVGAPAGEPILRGERGMPLWPEGFTGSMTHTEGLRAAVAAPLTTVRSLGLDAEPNEELPAEVLPMIARSGELLQLAELRPQVSAPDRLLFCAKEATYKAWFPLTHRWRGFEDAEISLRSDGTLIAYLLVRPTPVPFIAGRWVERDGYFIVAMTVPR